MMKSYISKYIEYLESESLYLVLKVLGTPKSLDVVRYLTRSSNVARDEVLTQLERILRTNDLATETDLAHLEVEIRELKIRFAQLKGHLSMENSDRQVDRHSK